VVALTGAEATEAIRLADDLSEKLRSLDALSSSSLEAETTAFKTVHPPFHLENFSGISTVQKARLM
jgi:hypothetical protein